jgi:hypothetical protein
MKIFLAIFLAFSTSAFALEVDEKLTVRIFRTSETRKTIMINRGTEDGLVEGDHAKFIVTAGIVARAVCVKVSPTRSVWSVYRLVNADFIVNDSVMSIKITPPVKITKDDSRSLVQEDTPTTVGPSDPNQLGIPLAEGADDLGKTATTEGDAADLKAIEDSGPLLIVERNVEIFGILNISGLSATTKTDTGTDSFSNTQSSHHIGLGGELYARKEREWYSHFSLIASANLMRMHNQAYNGSASTNDVNEFSIGANWHPTKLPSQTMAFIPYLHASVNVGSVRSTYEPGTEGNGTTLEKTANGGTQGFSLGFGYKFYTARGFGARVLFDYYLRTERYGEDDDTNKFNKSVGGPRFMIGLGYRF